MPQALTRDYGWAEYSEADVLDFPRPIPGFAHCRRYLTLRPRAGEPFVVLQSLDDDQVAFLTLPVETLVPDYRLRLVADDQRILAGDAGTGVAGRRVLVMMALSPEGEATVNLLGPVVIDVAARRGVQAIRDDARYQAAESVEALLAASQEAVCS